MPKGDPELAKKMGERMSKRRLMLGLSLEKTAELAGISYAQYHKAENGKTTINSDTLLKISTALKVTPDYLLLGEECGIKHPEVVDLLNQLEEDQIGLVSHMIASFSEYIKLRQPIK